MHPDIAPDIDSMELVEDAMPSQFQMRRHLVDDQMKFLISQTQLMTQGSMPNACQLRQIMHDGVLAKIFGDEQSQSEAARMYLRGEIGDFKRHRSAPSPKDDDAVAEEDL